MRQAQVSAGAGARGGILLAMRSMSRILSVDREKETVDVEGGVVWRDLVHHVKRWNLFPDRLL